MARTCGDRRYLELVRAVILAVVALLSVPAPGLAAACGSDTDEVDAGCYDGDLPAALGVALASDRPLLLSSGTYPLS